MGGRAGQVVVLVFVGVGLLWMSVGEQVRSALTPDREGCAHSGDVPRPGKAEETRAAVLCLVNQHRAKAGLKPLVADPALQAAAREHAEDMGERDFFAHRSPDGDGPDRRIRRAGFAGRATGENLYWGAGETATPAAAVDGWMGSPGHRKNILHASFTHAGIGIAYDAPDRPVAKRAGVYVNTFGG